MGFILPMKGKTASISKEAFTKCLEMSKDIIKR